MPVVRSIVRTADGLCQMVKQSLRLYMLGVCFGVMSTDVVSSVFEAFSRFVCLFLWWACWQ